MTTPAKKPYHPSELIGEDTTVAFEVPRHFNPSDIRGHKLDPGEPAYQRQMRELFLGESKPPDELLDLGRAQVQRVSRAVASQMILKYEWLGTMRPATFMYGIFFGPYCGGVTVTGVGGGTTGGIHTHKKFQIYRHELATLARGACASWAPLGANSKLTAWTVRLLRRDIPRAKLIIAYADENAGEIGTIYQACNWVYLGKERGAPKDWIAPNGRRYSQKLTYDLTKRSKMIGNDKHFRDALRAQGWKEAQTLPKHRYCCILDRTDQRLVALVNSLRKPYPKRTQAHEQNPDHREAGRA